MLRVPVARRTYNELEAENAALRAALRIAKETLSKDRLELKRMEQSRYEIVRMIEATVDGPIKR